MTCLILAALLTMGAAPLTFESDGSLADWDVLDYRGDARIERATVEDCPPGHGPEVTRLSGTLVVLLARDGHLQDGTYVALYRERAPATEDADGVVLFGGSFGDDLGLEHNTKTIRPHVWLEQDNDTGLSFRFAPAEGEDRALAEKVAEGLVTDAWNVSGWIWQKVQLQEGTMRAKYWPAHRAEPSEWLLEQSFDLPGDRFGIRINSGAIDLAWFAASREDIPVPAPAHYLYLPRTSITKGEALPGTLFSNTTSAAPATPRYDVIDGAGAVVGQGALDATGATANGDLPFAIAPSLPEGRFTLRLTPSPASKAVERAFHVTAASDFPATLAARTETLRALEAAADGDVAAMEIAQVARGLLDHVKSLQRSGKTEEAKAALRFVNETLAELHGVAGASLRDAGDAIQWEKVPSGYDASTGVGSAEHGVADRYRSASRLRFGAPACSAESLVMGRSYTFRIPLEVLGTAPRADFAIQVAMQDPLGIRTVAEATLTPEPPTSQWQPGATYWQEVTLAIPRDDAVSKVSQPVILDERHHLVLSVREPASGAHVVLDNDPGAQPGRVGHRYGAGQFYVSSAPVEIQSFEVQPTPHGDTVQARVRCLDGPRSCVARLRYLAPSGRTLLEQVQPVALDGSTAKPLSFSVKGRHRGEAVAELSLWDGSRRLTEVVRDLKDDSAPLTIKRKNHVERQGGALRTPVALRKTAGAEAIDVLVQAGSRTLATVEDLGQDTVLALPPHFGYYDIAATSGNTTWHYRIVATVVEAHGGELLVNGEPFIVKGVNVHGMDSRSPARTRLMMELLKDLGFNSLRGDYPPRWQLDMAEEIGLTYDVLAPFSVSSTAEIFARQDGPPLATARALTRQFIARYRDAAAALLWNSCNEITDENIPFLLAQYPLYGLHDPYERPVHYANLYGQDLWQGQDVMGVNYYFSDTQRAVDRHPLIERSAAIAQERGLPMIYTEYNSYHGAIPTTGVEAMEDLFTWGVEQAGMAGGYFYMLPDSDRHPGVMDHGYNTHGIMNDAFHRAFDDVELTGHWTDDGPRGGRAVVLEFRNKRPFFLRNFRVAGTIGGVPATTTLHQDIAPGASLHARLFLPEKAPGPDYTAEGRLVFETHHGLPCEVPFRAVVEGSLARDDAAPISAPATPGEAAATSN